MVATTHRPLPADAGDLALAVAEREAVAAAWTGRARNELSTSGVFASLTRSLIALGADTALVRQAATAVADEVRHAEICVHVARGYAPLSGPPAPSELRDPPRFGGSEELDVWLFVVLQSCINEGVATGYLQRCLDEACTPLARAAVRDILSDEIHHARLGWSLLASGKASDSLRGDLAEALPTLLRMVADAWASPHPDAPLAPPGHGVVAPSSLPEVVRATYHELILPGFDAVGIDTGPARDWVRWRFDGGPRALIEGIG
jgi:hypothetical protein